MSSQVSLTIDLPRTVRMNFTPLLLSTLAGIFLTPHAEEEAKDMRDKFHVVGKNNQWAQTIAGSLYLQFPLSLLVSSGTELHARVSALWQAFPTYNFQHLGVNYAGTNQLIGSLILIGAAGKGTGFHVDIANAVNIAFSVFDPAPPDPESNSGACADYADASDREDPSTGDGACPSAADADADAALHPTKRSRKAPASANKRTRSSKTHKPAIPTPVIAVPQAPTTTTLAYWLFVRPVSESIIAVSSWLQAQLPTRYCNGFKFANDTPAPALTVAEIQELHSAHPSHTLLLEQHHNEVIIVPVGWPHCVTNAAFCVKIAFDRVLAGDMAKAALCQRLVISEVFGHAPPDYVGLIPKVANELEHLDSI